MKDKTRYFDYLSAILSVFVLLGMYIFPDITRESVSNALYVCANKIIPSLLPYIIATKLFSSYILKLEKNAVRTTAFKTDFSVLLLGMLSGFPSGAVIASSFYENGSVSKEKAEVLISCSNSISPAFCITIFGNDILNGRIYGVITLLAVIAVNLTLYFLQLTKLKKGSQKRTQKTEKKDIPNSAVFTSAITAGMTTTVNICAFVMFFMCIGNIIKTVLDFFGNGNSAVCAAICSMIEITGGLELINELNYGTRFIIGNAVMGFGGISAIMQVVSVCNTCALSPRRFIFTRIVSFFAVPAISILLLSVIPSNILAASNVVGKIIPDSTLGIGAILLSAAVVIAIIAIFVIKMRKEYKKSKIIL